MQQSFADALAHAGQGGDRLPDALHVVRVLTIKAFLGFAMLWPLGLSLVSTAEQQLGSLGRFPAAFRHAVDANALRNSPSKNSLLLLSQAAMACYKT